MDVKCKIIMPAVTRNEGNVFYFFGTWVQDPNGYNIVLINFQPTQATFYGIK